MAIILLVCVLVIAASAAPTANDEAYREWQQEMFDRMELNKLQEVYPAKRSNFGSLYISPCAAAASAYTPTAAASIPGYASPAATPYSYSHAAYQPAPAHPGYAPSRYGQSYYRSGEELENEQDLLGFSDMSHVAFDHVPMARYSYGGAQVAQIGGNTGGQAVVSGPVVGVFSNANVGGCSVPLLVSCTPSIAQGRIVKAQQSYNSGPSGQQSSLYQGNLYRGIDEQPHQDAVERQQEKVVPTSSSEHLLHKSNSIGDKHQ